jgi:hypothetical protein
MPLYLRPGTTINVPLTGDFTGGTVTASSITVQGGDCTVSGVAQAAATLSFNVSADEDAVPGLRDIRIAYANQNAIPVIKIDHIEVLKVGCKGSRLHFHTNFPTGTTYPSGMPAQDEVGNDKKFYGITGSTFFPPRIWFWDYGDQNVPGATALYPRWNATDATTAPNINNTVTAGRECALAGNYLAGDPTNWFTPLVAGSYQCRQWSVVTGAKAYAMAPDEMAGQSGAIVPEQKWDGFPTPITPVPGYISNMTNIPIDSFFRKPHFYMGTGDHFWDNAGLSDGTQNQTWAGSGGSNQARFTALPMWWRGTNSASFDPNYGLPFLRLRALEQGPNFFGYNPLSGGTGDTSAQAPMKSIMMLSIEPIECVLPGPQTEVNYNFPSRVEKTRSVYKRRDNENPSRGKSTIGAKIKVMYQDLYAFSDYYGGGGVVPGIHQMSDPVVIAEAYCPRIDVVWDYAEWNNRGQPTPDATPAADPDCRYPKVTMSSQHFEWKRVLKRGDQVTVGNSANPLGSGKYLDDVDLLAQAADLFMKEFDGYQCKFMVDDAWWSPIAASNPDQQWFGPAPAGRNYDADLLDREGTFLAVSGYIEVVGTK